MRAPDGVPAVSGRDNGCIQSRGQLRKPVMRETRIRVAEDVDSGALAGASHAVGQVVDLLAAIRSPPGHQNVADAELAQCRVCGIVARLHDEVRFVVAVILLENRADVLFTFRFILRLHLLIVRAAPDSLCHNLCGEHARLERVPHPFTAKRIHHAGCITNRDEVSGQSIVSERSGHQAVFSIDISAQRIFLYQETRVRASALNRYGPSIAVIEEGKFQHGTLGPRLNVLDSKISGTSAFGEPAQLPRRIDHHRAFHSVHVKHAAMTLYLLNPASLLHACMPGHHLIQHSARNAQPPPLKWELDFRGSGAYARRSHFNSACVQNLIDETEPAQTTDRTLPKETATAF